MNLAAEFSINNTQSIRVLVPDRNEKFNYYYEPTNELHMFDQVEVVLQKDGKLVRLAQDMVDIIIGTFKYNLENILNKKCYLPDRYEPGQLGHVYNLDIQSATEDFFDTSSFALWATAENITFLYRKDNNIYLEISPKYLKPKTYKPILFLEIDEYSAKEWLARCNVILENSIKPGH